MEPIEREYWKKAEIPLDQYPEVDDDAVQFPEDIYITYAVCQKACGNAEFIVDGSTQICDLCGKIMFRTAVRRYRLALPSDPVAEIDHSQGAWVEVDKKGHRKS